MVEDSIIDDQLSDERFKLKARFRKKKRKIIERDERFDKVFEDDLKLKTGPKIDPFGRPLDDTQLDDIYSSSEDEEDEIEQESTVKEEKEDIEYGEESDRIAVIGCDWDNITADDLFVLFETIYRSINNNDYVKAVKRAAIYLSDIGEKKVSEENVSGPSIENGSEIRDEEEDDETRQEALRKYQKERSRYYYGVVEFDSVEKAKILYDELDGTEVSFAIDCLDLRFIPATVEFPREPTTESFKIPDNYQPPISTQSALRHSKVECKWDTTPAKRFKTLTKRFTEQELASLDLSEYLASDESDDENNKDNINDYKRLIKEREELEKDEEEDGIEDEGEEVSEYGSDDDSQESDTDLVNNHDKDGVDRLEFNMNKDRDNRISATVGNFKISFGPNVAIQTENVVENGSDYNGSQKKRKDKQKNKRERIDDEPEEGRHFDMRYLKTKKHKNKEQQIGFKSNFDDERLSRVFKDPKFSIDTTDPNFKKTEFNKKLLEQKSKHKN